MQSRGEPIGGVGGRGLSGRRTDNPRSRRDAVEEKQRHELRTDGREGCFRWEPVGGAASGSATAELAVFCAVVGVARISNANICTAWYSRVSICVCIFLYAIEFSFFFSLLYTLQFDSVLTFYNRVLNLYWCFVSSLGGFLSPVFGLRQQTTVVGRSGSPAIPRVIGRRLPRRPRPFVPRRRQGNQQPCRTRFLSLSDLLRR